MYKRQAYSRDHDNLEIAVVSPEREQALLDALASEPGVEHAARMEVFRASFVPDDPLYKDQWHLTRVGAETAWEFGCGRGVTVAVIDPKGDAESLVRLLHDRGRQARVLPLGTAAPGPVSYTHLSR